MGVAVGHVLGQAADADRVDLRLAAGERLHQAGDHPGATHVPLHVLHPGGGFDGDAARIEGDAFADEGYGSGRLTFGIGGTVPPHDDQLRLATRPLAYAQQRAHALPAHSGGAQHLHFNAELGQVARPIGETLRIDDVCRLGDEITGKENAIGDLREAPHDLARIARVAHEHRESFQTGLLFGLFLGAVLVEPVGTQKSAVGVPGRALAGLRRRSRQLVDDERHAGFAAGRQICVGRSAEGLQIEGAELAHLAQPGQEYPAVAELGGGQQLEPFALTAGKAAGRDGPLDRTPGFLVQCGSRGAQLLALGDADDQGAFVRQAVGGKSDLHGISPLRRRLSGRRRLGLPARPAITAGNRPFLLRPLRFTVNHRGRADALNVPDLLPDPSLAAWTAQERERKTPAH
jgi:hypothetical protein